MCAAVLPFRLFPHVSRLTMESCTPTTPIDAVISASFLARDTRLYNQLGRSSNKRLNLTLIPRTRSCGTDSYPHASRTAPGAGCIAGAHLLES